MNYTAPTRLEQGLILLGCIIGQLSTIDLTYHVLAFIDFNNMALYSALPIMTWSALCYAILLFISFVILRKLTLLNPFKKTYFIREKLIPALIGAAFLTFIALFCNDKPINLLSMHSHFFLLWWVQFLITLYRAFNKSVIYYLFWLPLLLLIFTRIFKKVHNTYLILTAIIITALLPNIIYLPFAYLRGISFLVMTKVFVWNLIEGIVMGSLFWKKGFWTIVLTQLFIGIMVPSAFYLLTIIGIV